MKKQFHRIKHWLIDRLINIHARDRFPGKWLVIFFIATTISTAVFAIGNPNGSSLYSHMLNIGKITALNGLLYFAWTFILAAFLSFIYLPVPRLFIASFTYTIASTIFILMKEGSGKVFSYIIGLGYALSFTLIGILIIILFHERVKSGIKIICIVSLVALSSAYLIFDKIDFQQQAVPAFAEYTGPTIENNPALKGDFDPVFIAYGSGNDLRRSEFGKEVDVLTESVDASYFITKWGKGREKFWGFGPSNLPVNGRMWMPDGEGVFPLILMVHGNHTMEYFSTDGYDYLGELLASRGFIAISVDEDFINYSNAYGSPNDNYTLRAWMLLQHLIKLQEMNNDPENQIYQKIDFDRVALVGHSRGGQAALMAADYKSFFEEEDILESMENIDIKGVVAIAPTDNTVNDKKAKIHNTSYLLLHGAKDADVYDFRGDLQYYRATFDKDYDGFKSTLYIADANHTQFNTSWGSMDLSLPRGLFLNKRQTMKPEDQQQIAKVYLSAFFERIFHNEKSYEKLFQDYRYGKNWLPDTVLVSKYQHPKYQSIVTYRQESAETLDVDGFTKHEILRPENRRGQKRLRYSLQLEWEQNATYNINLSKDYFNINERIVLTMANINDHVDHDEEIPEIDVELHTTDGISVKVPLNDIFPVSPVISVDYTHFGLFDQIFRDGKYKKSWEPIFQTFEIPMEIFAGENPQFKQENIDKLTLHFKEKPAGKVLIEEIGIY